MAIDIPANQSAALRSLQNSLANSLGQRQEVLQTVLRALNIREGDTFTALVKAVQEVGEPLRARILNLAQPVTETDPRASARNAGATTPAAELDSTELVALLKSARLKLVELEIRGRTLLTFTERPLQTGAKIDVQIRGGQLLLQPDTSAASRPGAGVTGATTAQNNAALMSSGRPLLQILAQASAATGRAVTPGLPMSAEPSAQSPKPMHSQHTLALQQTLRSLLPQQSPGEPVISRTLELISNLSRLLAQPANRALRSEIPASLQASLRSVATFIRSAQQLSQPQSLQRALSDAGLQMENRLATRAINIARPDAANDPKSMSQALRALVTQTLPKTDLKAALEQLATLLKDVAPAPAASRFAATPVPEPLYLVLRQLLKLPPSQQAVTARVDRDQLLNNLQQQVNQSLDKILLQQLNSLQRSSSGNETGSTQHWQLELPVRYGHELHMMQLRIDEYWIHEYPQEDKRRPTSRVQQWLVKLSFELPDAGTLHAHLCVVENTVSASLWAENSTTLERARGRMAQLKQRLEADGVSVKKLECFVGRPVQDDIQLNYSLVDIKT